jgi:Domain of unknown function (DUF6438)
MVKASLWGAALLSLCASGCDGTTPAGASDGAGTGAAGLAEIDASTTVTMKRAGCFGACPVYSVRIGGDGSVEFSGESYVRFIGEATGQVPAGDVERLVGAMLDADYFSLSSESGCGPGDDLTFTTDASGATISLTLGEQTKTIQDYHGNSCAPRVLRSIEDLIDEIAGTASWVKCDTPDGYCYRAQGGD